MDVKEKLVELLQNAKAAMKSENLSCDIARNMFVVDFMMSNGVTVQEWISVKDRQPNNKGCYLLTVKHWFDGEPVVREACWNGKDWFSCDDRRYKITPRVTHWMLLPQPPKGVNDGESVD